MAYSVREIYYTLQGEGAQAGRAAVFLRFSGCNLWSGRENQRPQGPGGCAAWCDTLFVGTGGPGGGKFSSANAVADTVASYWPASSQQHRLVVCTGGEPLLQLDAPLIDALHTQGFQVAVETNGTITPPAGIDWLTVSPKAKAPLKVRQGDELKLVFPQPEAEMAPEHFSDLAFHHFFLQPLDSAERERNTLETVQFCQENPQWRLSLQQHKYLNIP